MTEKDFYYNKDSLPVRVTYLPERLTQRQPESDMRPQTVRRSLQKRCFRSNDMYQIIIKFFLSSVDLKSKEHEFLRLILSVLSLPMCNS